MMRLFQTLALIALVGACQTPPPQSALAQRTHEARIASPAPALGIVVATCANGVEIAQDGRARIDAAAPLAAHARFNIGSNAKSMLAMLAATFVDQGALRWDTTIEEVFAAEAATFDPVVRQATLAQLLSHRSGLAGFASGAELGAIEPGDGPPSAQRLRVALQILRSPPPNAPGQEFVYSNGGYIVAGAMLERVGGKPFEALMRERVFAPLRMRDARFGASTPDETGQPLGHYTRDGVQAVYLESEPAIPAFLQPAGDVSLPLSDYGLYLSAHLCGLQGRATPVLSSNAIQFLHRAQGEDGASMGWGAYAFSGAPASIHVGGTGTFSAFVAVIPTRDLAIATVVNSGDAEARAAALSLMQAEIAERLAAQTISSD